MPGDEIQHGRKNTAVVQTRPQIVGGQSGKGQQPVGPAGIFENPAKHGERDMIRIVNRIFNSVNYLSPPFERRMVVF